MTALFYLSAAIAIFSALRVVTNSNAVHALLYLVTTLLSLAVTFYLLGAPFAAGLEVLVYAGAIMVLFVFATMMFNLNREDQLREKVWLRQQFWLGPSVLAALLLVQLIYYLSDTSPITGSARIVDAKAVGMALFGPYLLAVEIASFLLLAGLVAAYHVATNDEKEAAHD